MIIDSPLGRIAGVERVFAAENLPIYLPNTQITCLVTNTEIDAEITKDADTGERIPSVREIWEKEKRIWKRFVLKFSVDDDENTNTTIREVVN